MTGLRLIVWGLGLLLMTGSSHAAEIRVLTAGAYKAVAIALAPEFEKTSGHKLIIDNGTAGALQKRIEQGEAFDLAVITLPVMTALSKQGLVQTDGVRNLAKVGIGVGIKAGAEKPDLSTVDGFKQMLLKARNVAYIDPAAGGTSGIYLHQLFERMGLGEQIKAKAVLVPGGLTAQRIVSGQADVAIQQISEIVAVPGVVLAGPLPDEVQNWTIYSAGINHKTANAEAAKALLEFLSSEQAKAVLTSKGMVAP